METSWMKSWWSEQRGPSAGTAASCAAAHRQRPPAAVPAQHLPNNAWTQLEPWQPLSAAVFVLLHTSFLGLQHPSFLGPQ